MCVTGTRQYRFSLWSIERNDIEIGQLVSFQNQRDAGRGAWSNLLWSGKEKRYSRVVNREEREERAREDARLTRCKVSRRERERKGGGGGRKKAEGEESLRFRKVALLPYAYRLYIGNQKPPKRKRAKEEKKGFRRRSEFIIWANLAFGDV